jgi:WD40 repeat protein
MTLFRIAFAGVLLPFLFVGHRAPGDSAKPQAANVAVDPHGDPLPAFARARLGTTRFRHGSAIQQVRYLKNGQVLMSVGVDGSLRHWEAESGKELLSFVPPGSSFTGQSGVVSPDGMTTASFESDGSIHLWNVATGKELRRLKSPTHQYGAPNFSPDGKSLATIVTDLNSGQGVVRLWDLATGKELRDFTPTVKNENQEIINLLNVFFSPDGKLIGALGQDNQGGATVRLWEAETGKELPRFMAARRNVNIPPVFAPDGKTAAVTTSDDNTGTSKLQLLDVATGKVIREIDDGNENGGFAALFSPNGKVLAVAGGNPLPKLWDTETGKELPALEVGDNNNGNGASSVVFAPDGRTVAVGVGNADGSSGSIFLCDVASGKKLHELKGYQAGYGNVRVQFNDGSSPLSPSIAFSPDGKRLVATGKGGSLRIWTTADGKEWRPVQGGHDGEVNALALSPDGKKLATAAGDLTVRLWDLVTGKELLSLKAPEPMQNPPDQMDIWPTALAFAPDGKTIAIGWMDGILQVRNLTTGKEIQQYKGHENSVRAVLFHPNGKSLVSSCDDGRVFWWDVGSGRQLRQLAGPIMIDPNVGQPDAVIPQGLAISPDGRLLVGAGLEEGLMGKVRVWELSTGKLRRQIKLPYVSSSEVFQLQAGLGIAPAFGGFDGNNVSGIANIAMAADGKTVGVALGSTIRLVDISTGKELRQFGGQNGFVHDLEFAPDGKLLASAGSDGTVRFWDVATGTILTDLKGHRGGVNALTFTPDGKTVITGGSDTTALLWDFGRALEAEKAQPDKPGDGELADLWKHLADEDGEKAEQAIVRLTQAPDAASALLKRHVKPVPAADEKLIRRLLADLESERFDTRKQAGEDLEKLAELAEPYLQERLKGNPSLEARQRLEQLLEKLAGPVTNPEQVQSLRAVEVLERLATPEARALLTELAKGAPAARLTQDAQSAVKRLK